MYKKYLKLLQQTGKTTYQVCHDAHIPESTMSMWKRRYEEGKDSKMSLDNVAKLAKVFGVPIEYFLTSDEP